MKRLNSQSGFSQIIVTVLALAVVGAVAFAAYMVISSNSSSEPSSSSEASSVPSTIESADDLNQAGDSVDQTNVDDLNPSDVDQDVNALL